VNTKPSCLLISCVVLSRTTMQREGSSSTPPTYQPGSVLLVRSMQLHNSRTSRLQRRTNPVRTAPVHHTAVAPTHPTIQMLLQLPLLLQVNLCHRELITDATESLKMKQPHMPPPLESPQVTPTSVCGNALLMLRSVTSLATQHLKTTSSALVLPPT
jgi:hypothetical protein